MKRYRDAYVLRATGDDPAHRFQQGDLLLVTAPDTFDRDDGSSYPVRIIRRQGKFLLCRMGKNGCRLIGGSGGNDIVSGEKIETVGLVRALVLSLMK